MFGLDDPMESFKRTYGNLNDIVQNIIDILTMSPESNHAVWASIENVFNVLLPVGYSVATIFILMTFVNQAMLFKLNNYERIVKLFLVFTIGKVILENSFDLMGWLYSETANLMLQAGKITPMENLVDMNELEAHMSQMNRLDRFIFWTQSLPTTAIVSLINTTVNVFAYGRLIELYVYMALAPLPLSTAVSEDHRSIAKSFFQSYIGVCIQGFIMLLCCIIYTGLAIEFKDPTQNASMMGGFGGYLLASMVLLLVLAKSGNWAKEIVGLR
ncbi:hypothetical protein [Sinanaerobacter sp. ZZT-01]|uniref:hypothetical protein n=1 Tax=Sinanaerobacter sp. ZZT-01 TaxID=3111540 RepID=UPI002D79BFF9|nr:hypothetical protein [Sinanaerobacter sp. ZZT-01]WRR94241.1 hypothetical protein U5921_03730 [Sinanaerobacter sp. ZZT-01]